MKNIERKPINIIFLDIEGVLATHRVQFSRFQRGLMESFDPVVVNFLDGVCSKYLCYIVVTSKSRIEYNDIEWFKSRMIQCGANHLDDFLFPDGELWRTTTTNFECRALEIDDWFTKFHKKHDDKFFINTYAVIDDNYLGSISMHDNHFVHVSKSCDGMAYKDFKKLVEILEKN